MSNGYVSVWPCQPHTQHWLGGAGMDSLAWFDVALLCPYLHVIGSKSVEKRKHKKRQNWRSDVTTSPRRYVTTLFVRLGKNRCGFAMSILQPNLNSIGKSATLFLLMRCCLALPMSQSNLKQIVQTHDLYSVKWDAFNFDTLTDGVTGYDPAQGRSWLTLILPSRWVGRPHISILYGGMSQRVPFCVFQPSS